MTTNITLTIPARFWEDHVDRDLVEYPYTEQVKGRRVVVTLHPLDADELLSDAEHYAGFFGEDRSMNLGICSSAAATVKAIRKQFDAAAIAEWGQ